MRLLSLFALLVAVPAAAQAPADTSCAYAVCALRAERGFLGVTVVRGEAGEVVTDAGFFGGIDLRWAVDGSPAALEHVERYESARSRFYIALGAAVGLSALAGYAAEEDNGGLAATAYLGALGAAFYGSTQALQAEREASRAIWDYNAQFAD